MAEKSMANVDFFISRAGGDSEIAKAVAKIFEDAGYSTILQDWDFGHADFVAKMDDALSRATRTITLLSRSYLRSEYCGAEWRSIFARDPRNFSNRLILFRIEECEPTGLLSLLAYTDLVSALENPHLLRQIILARVNTKHSKEQYIFLENYRKYSATIVNEKIRRVPNFVGRSESIFLVLEAMRDGNRPVVLTGVGGIGKTALAIEFGLRYQDEFSGVWFIDAATDQTTQLGFIALGDVFIPGLRETKHPTDAVSKTKLLLEQYRERPWLLIFDNVRSELDLRNFAGLRGAKILATTRAATWGDDVIRVTIRDLSLEEAVAYLHAESGREDGSEEEWAKIAQKVCYLPLALSHCAIYLRRAKAVSLRRFIERIDELIAQSPTLQNEEVSVRATYRLAIEQAEQEAAGAAIIMKFVSFFEGLGMPLETLEQKVEVYPKELQPFVLDERARENALSALARLSLVALDLRENILRTHALVALAAVPMVETANWYVSVMCALYQPLMNVASLSEFQQHKVRSEGLRKLTFEQIQRYIAPGLPMDLKAFKYGAQGRLVALGIFSTWMAVRFSEDEWNVEIEKRRQVLDELWKNGDEDSIKKFRINKSELIFDYIRRGDLGTACRIQLELCRALYLSQKALASLPPDALKVEVNNYIGMALDLGIKRWVISQTIEEFGLHVAPFDGMQLLSGLDLHQPAFRISPEHITELVTEEAAISPPDPAIFLHRVNAVLVNAGMPRSTAEQLMEFFGRRLGVEFEHLMSVPQNSGVLSSDEELARCILEAFSFDETYTQSLARLEANLISKGVDKQRLENLIDDLASQFLVNRKDQREA